MVITKIEAQKNPKRVNIYIDDEFAFGLDENIRYKYGLKSKMEITRDFIDNVLREEEENTAFSLVLNYLSFRQRSEKEVRDYLLEKDYGEDLILRVIDRCKHYDYINDYEFAKSFIKDKLGLKKHGFKRISYELSHKGIDRNIVDDIIYEISLENEDLEYNMALELAQKRLRSYRNDDRPKKYSKLSGYLQRRGYGFDIVSRVVKEVLRDED